MSNNILFGKPTPEYAKELISYLPVRPDYQTWIYAISAVGNTFPEDIAIDILLSHFQDERTNETTYKVVNRLKNVTFGSLVYLAKQNGYLPKISHRNRPYGTFPDQSISDYVCTKKKPVKFEKETGLFRRFKDYELEERAGIMEYDGNLTRLQAEQRILQDYPDAEWQNKTNNGVYWNLREIKTDKYLNTRIKAMYLTKKQDRKPDIQTDQGNTHGK